MTLTDHFVAPPPSSSRPCPSHAPSAPSPPPRATRPSTTTRTYPAPSPRDPSSVSATHSSSVHVQTPPQRLYGPGFSVAPRARWWTRKIRVYNAPPRRPGDRATRPCRARSPGFPSTTFTLAAQAATHASGAANRLPETLRRRRLPQTPYWAHVTATRTSMACASTRCSSARHTRIRRQQDATSSNMCLLIFLSSPLYQKHIPIGTIALCTSLTE